MIASPILIRPTCRRTDELFVAMAVVKVGEEDEGCPQKWTMVVEVGEGDRNMCIHLEPRSSNDSHIETMMKMNSTHLYKSCHYFDKFLKEWRISSPSLTDISFYMIPGCRLRTISIAFCACTIHFTPSNMRVSS